VMEEDVNRMKIVTLKRLVLENRSNLQEVVVYSCKKRTEMNCFIKVQMNISFTNMRLAFEIALA